MERGTFHHPEVRKLFKEFTLLEVFTDRPWERDAYGKNQQEIAATTALPTYVILDSEQQLEVTRSYYTNDDEEFVKFLEEGLENQPGFFSLIRFTNLNGLKIEGSLDSSRGEDFTFRGETHSAYHDTFWANQGFQVPKDLKPGKYVLGAELITAVYHGKDRGELISIPIKLPFEVVN